MDYRKDRWDMDYRKAGAVVKKISSFVPRRRWDMDYCKARWDMDYRVNAS
uniref:Uncharacterized protein n=1 Tax=Oryza sativa subsp. japonica TaxID=39947 RepID=Q2R1L8_ORYSJ|nr:hypothetical protein LOC_Os11g38770 [Oryza sativa Japonica Group]